MKYEKFDILKKAKYSIVPNNRENEIQAQVYANFMCEFIETTEEPF